MRWMGGGCGVESDDAFLVMNVWMRVFMSLSIHESAWA